MEHLMLILILKSSNKLQMSKKLKEWSKLSKKEKSKYNGYKGFVNGILWTQSNAFLSIKK